MIRGFKNIICPNLCVKCWMIKIPINESFIIGSMKSRCIFGKEIEAPSCAIYLYNAFVAGRFIPTLIYKFLYSFEIDRRGKNNDSKKNSLLLVRQGRDA